jgi:membrane protease YdiL (CAAX protease family)
MPESRLAAQIKHNPTVSFFVLAFFISWTGWFLAPAASRLGPHFSAFVSLVGSFGPAFSAILVSRIVNAKPSGASATKRRVTFVLIVIVSFLVQLLATYVVGGNINYQTVVFAIFSAIIVSYVVSSAFHPREGVVHLLSGLKQVSLRNFWVWTALLMPFVLQFLGALVDLSLGGNEWFSLTPDVLFALIGYYPFIVLFGGGLNEEPGWRGLAVPLMQRRYSPLVAGLIIGIVWSMWHLPLHATGVVAGGLESFPFRFVYNVPLGLLFGWLYNRSEGNLFACVLLHASYNSAGTIFGSNAALISMVLMIVFTVIVAVYDRMWLKGSSCGGQSWANDDDGELDKGNVAFYSADADKKTETGDRIVR